MHDRLLMGIDMDAEVVESLQLLLIKISYDKGHSYTYDKNFDERYSILPI
jgi:hypothetical protein